MAATGIVHKRHGYTVLKVGDTVSNASLYQRTIIIPNLNWHN